MVDVAVITGYGLNTDYESEEAFRLTGANPVRIHINDLITGKDSLENYQIMMVPGGFSYGDHLGSGKVLANKFRFNLREDLKKFIEADKLIIGVCNGFQILVKMGILPALDGEYFSQSVTITYNKSGQFESRWVRMKPNQKESMCLDSKFKNSFRCSCKAWRRTIHSQGRSNFAEIVGQEPSSIHI